MTSRQSDASGQRRASSSAASSSSSNMSEAGPSNSRRRSRSTRISDSPSRRRTSPSFESELESDDEDEDVEGPTPRGKVIPTHLRWPTFASSHFGPTGRSKRCQKRALPSVAVQLSQQNRASKKQTYSGNSQSNPSSKRPQGRKEKESLTASQGAQIEDAIELSSSSDEKGKKTTKQARRKKRRLFLDEEEEEDENEVDDIDEPASASLPDGISAFIPLAQSQKQRKHTRTSVDTTTKGSPQKKREQKEEKRERKSRLDSERIGTGRDRETGHSDNVLVVIDTREGESPKNNDVNGPREALTTSTEPFLPKDNEEEGSEGQLHTLPHSIDLGSARPANPTEAVASSENVQEDDQTRLHEEVEPVDQHSVPLNYPVNDLQKQVEINESTDAQSQDSNDSENEADEAIGLSFEAQLEGRIEARLRVAMEQWQAETQSVIEVLKGEIKMLRDSLDARP